MMGLLMPVALGDALDHWHALAGPQDMLVNDLVATPNGLLAVGHDTANTQGVVLRFVDGATWTVTPVPTSLPVRSVTQHGERWLAVASGHVPHLDWPHSVRSAILHSADGVHWTAQPVAGHILLQSVVAGPNVVIAVGQAHVQDPGVEPSEDYRPVQSVILTSVDGHTWTSTLGPGNGLLTVCFGDGRYVAAGEAGAVFSSTDGFDWRQQDSGTSFSIRKLLFANGQFVGVGGYPGAGTPALLVTITSNNGIDWIAQHEQDRSSLHDLAWGRDRFVGVGAWGAVCTSRDGQGWRSRAVPTVDDHVVAVVFDGNRFIATGAQGALFQSDPVPENPLSIEFQSSRIEASESAGQVDLQVRRLGDARPSVSVEWSFADRPLSAEADLRPVRGKVDFSPGQTLARLTLTVFDDNLPEGDEIFTVILMNPSGGAEIGERNSMTLTIRDQAGIWLDHWREFQVPLPDITLSGAAFGHGRWVVIGERHGDQELAVAGVVLVSTNLTDWDVVESGITSALTGVTFGNGRFVAVGDGAAFWSLDGHLWNQGTIQTPVPLCAVAYGRDKFVAVGGVSGWFSGLFERVILASEDGETWKPLIREDRGKLNNITFASDRFVAVGDGPTILTSHDAAVWSRRDLTFQRGLHAVTYGAGRFVTVGGKFMMARYDWPRVHVVQSTDGFEWIECFEGAGDPMTAIAYGHGVFLAFGQNSLFTAVDPHHWTRRLTDLSWRCAVSFADNRFLVVGDDRILWSDVPPVQPVRIIRGTLTRSPAGGVGFMVAGPPAIPLVIEASTDLRRWTAIATVDNEQGTISFTDASPSDGQPRFYRARIW
jgi:hypothetical protein